jgi:predicted restriction endonuclease
MAYAEAGGFKAYQLLTDPHRKALRAKYRAMWDEGVHHHEAKQEAPEKLVPNIDVEQRKVLTKRRSQQSQLRAQVLVMENGCRVTGLQDPASLETAHMKPYATTNEFSAVDYDNCILLTPNMHNLFDRGLISFTDAGELMKSYALTYEQAAAMGVPALVDKPQRFRPEQIPYLRHHQRNVFIREKEEQVA